MSCKIPRNPQMQQFFPWILTVNQIEVYVGQSKVLQLLLKAGTNVVLVVEGVPQLGGN